VGDDTTLTAALLDPLLHHAHIVEISGESYRLRDRKKAGHVKAAATERLRITKQGRVTFTSAMWVQGSPELLRR
jgi:IstB-like ATP binding protein